MRKEKKKKKGSIYPTYVEFLTIKNMHEREVRHKKNREDDHHREWKIIGCHHKRFDKSKYNGPIGLQKKKKKKERKHINVLILIAELIE